jgi:hypothetical protein
MPNEPLDELESDSTWLDGPIFISHNHQDKAFARTLAAALTLAGAKVWFDDWEIAFGDSIVQGIESGLAGFGTFALLWSADAASSSWVQKERNAAFARWVANSSCRFVPVLLDDTPLPPLVSDLKYVDAQDGDHLRVAQQLLGIPTPLAFYMDVQEFIAFSGIEFRHFHGAGVFICCPVCGAPSSALVPISGDDPFGDRYAGVQCPACKWNDASEVPW